MGPITITGIGSHLTIQQTALLTLLSLLGPQSRERMIDRIWNGRAVSRSRFANLITEIRGVVGKDRLTLRDADGCYQLTGINSDHALFEQLVTNTSAQEADSDAEVALTRALGLVRGRLFDHRSSRYWHWLDDEYHLVFDASRSVVSASSRLAEIAIESSDHGKAIWACRQGLLAVPENPELLALADRLYASPPEHTVVPRAAAAGSERLWPLGNGGHDNV